MSFAASVFEGSAARQFLLQRVPLKVAPLVHAFCRERP